MHVAGVHRLAHYSAIVIVGEEYGGGRGKGGGGKAKQGGEPAKKKKEKKKEPATKPKEGVAEGGAKAKTGTRCVCCDDLVTTMLPTCYNLCCGVLGWVWR